MELVTIGIDPGKNGALVVLVDGKTPLYSVTTSDLVPGGKGGGYDAARMHRAVAPYGNVGIGSRSTAISRLAATMLDVLDSDGSENEDDPDGYFWDIVDDMRLLLGNNPLGASMAAIELQRAVKGEGRTSGLTTGVGYGLWRGILAANMIPTEEVSASVWTASLKCGGGGDKSVRVRECGRLIPELDLQPGQRRKAHDGLADAGLLALYAYRRVARWNST